ncbi:MAG: hypothetical protein EP340_11090 [Alphaproteobacteria bacterium]|nr:MAG: hypothetical protein EP340_11090 [Alphaproteobacteria bacterium]
MARVSFISIIGLCLSLWAGWGAASATDLEDVQLLYEAGNYAAAADMGEEVATSQAYALAARSLLGKINLQSRDDRKMSDIDRAINLAEKSLALDPENIEGHLQLATAFGFKARLLSMFRAKLAGLPEKSKRHLEEAIALDPDNAWAWAFLGAWHWEVVRKGGAGMAKSMYDATPQTGTAHFEKALALDGENPYVPYLYALTLLTSDIRAHETEALGLLEKTLARTATTHQARMTHARAEELIRLLKAKDYETALSLVADYQGLKPLKMPKQQAD